MSQKNTLAKEWIKKGESVCRTQNYQKAGKNWYRIYGEDLLQVVTFRGIPERVDDVVYNREPSVALIVFSLFESIPWVSVPIMGTKREIIPNILPSVLLSGQSPNRFLGTAFEAEQMVKLGLPFLDKIETHIHLAALLESYDRIGGAVQMNDPHKLIPYLLSGQIQKVYSVIDSIEKQNQQAHQDNCRRMPGYDEEMMHLKMIQQLSPLLSIRENLQAANIHAIVAQLRDNYNRNIDFLYHMGLDCCKNQLTDDDLYERIKGHL